MASVDDLAANAEYIRMADELVEVPGGPNNNNYANVSLIVEIAEAKGVDAVWAGWGHASEFPALPSALRSRGLVFIGPPAEPMHALGDKIGSTIIAQSARVPTIAWNGSDLVVDYAREGLPDEVYERANVRTAEAALAHAQRIGFPVMIKASEVSGRGGVGGGYSAPAALTHPLSPTHHRAVAAKGFAWPTATRMCRPRTARSAPRCPGRPCS